MHLSDLAAYETGVTFLDLEVPEGMRWTPNEQCRRHCGWPLAWCPYSHHHSEHAATDQPTTGPVAA